MLRNHRSDTVRRDRKTQKKNRSFKNKGLLFAIVWMSLCLTGCGDHELENREFPLAIGVESAKEGCLAAFSFPILSDSSGDNGTSGTASTALEKGRDFFTIQKNYEKNSSKSIDFSHNKVLILGEDFIKDEEQLQNFIDYARTQELMARNTYLFVTDLSMEELFDMGGKLEKPFGTYLEELLESDEDYGNKQIMTLGKLYDERLNQMETLFIPVLGAGEDNKPMVTASWVLKNGEPLKKVSRNTAMESLLIQGKLKGASFQDGDGNEWRLTHIKPSYELKKDLDHPGVTVEITCKAGLKNGRVADWREEEDLEIKLGEEISSRLTETAKKGLKKGFDLTNSYKKLGNHYRQAYRYYEERGGYEEAVHIEILVKPSLVN